MSIQKGKYFDVKKTKAYFDAMNTEMDKYIANADITNAEYDAFNASESFKGLTANSVKLLVKNRAGLFLNETVKAQKMVKDAQKYTLTTFANIVDSAPNARIEYDTLRTIETDFKGFYNKFRHISHRVDNLSDDLNREFGYYANFGKPNAPAVINEFNSFCGGESDGVGYLSECINKLVRFDEITHEYITRKEINTHSTTISTKAKSVGAALMAPVEKSKQLKDIVVAKISDADVPKNGGGVNGKYAALQKQFGFSDKDMEYLSKYYPGLLSSLDGARRYSSSDADVIYNQILRKLEIHGHEAYAEEMTGYDRMDQEKINSNAEYIYSYLRDKGWSKEAICGLLGNMDQESGINPDVWQFQVNGNRGGYGLVQFTGDDRKEFYKYANDYLKDYISEDYTVPEVFSSLAEEDPQLAINCQLDYLMQSNSWYYSSGYSGYFDFSGSKYAEQMPDQVMIPFDEYQKSEASPACLALIFHAGYERSGDTVSQRDERGESADDWYEYFKDYE